MLKKLPNQTLSCLVIAGDSREKLKQFHKSVDLIVTSPPYADARKGHYDSIHPDRYVDWFMSFHEPLLHALKPEGSLIINLKDKIIGGVRHRFVWRLIDRLCESGWHAIDDYLWHKTNPMPGYWPTRLRDGWEYCFHLAQSKRPFMNQSAVRQPVGSWVKSRLQRLGKNDLSRHNSVNASGFGRDISRWVGRDTVLPSNVLSLPLVGKNKGHPAVFPVELPEFFIKLLCPPRGLVLDPFGGSGTTAIAALSLGRDAVVIDNNPQYCQIAYDRILKETSSLDFKVVFEDQSGAFTQEYRQAQAEQLVLELNQEHSVYQVPKKTIKRSARKQHQRAIS